MSENDSVFGTQRAPGEVQAEQKSDAQWREALSAEDYRICREKGTERPFSGKYLDEKTPGVYLCKCCSAPLFDSESKYDSGSGWPSFTAPHIAQNIGEHRDRSVGMDRVEIVCSRCDAHLGHVFPDGPGPTGMRYCVNSASLTLEPKG